MDINATFANQIATMTKFSDKISMHNMCFDSAKSSYTKSYTKQHNIHENTPNPYYNVCITIFSF